MAGKKPYPTRYRVIVDLETTGLDATKHEVVEAAWHCLETGETGCFVPPHTLEGASERALQVNRYAERLIGAPRDDGTALRRMHERLYNSRLVGANPAFDAAFLSALFRRAELPAQPWHFRLLDVEAYGAGVLGLPDGAVPGLSELARLVGITVDKGAAHGALADVLTTVEVYKRLAALAGKAKLRAVPAPPKPAEAPWERVSEAF